jgi:2-isopropylmalate synthase
LLARQELLNAHPFFELERYRVISERRRNAKGEVVTVSEAVATIWIGTEKITSFYENEHGETNDAGPVNALSQAIKKDLGRYQDLIEGMELVDFKVRITNGGTEAVTRVIIDSEDETGRRWSTVGVSANILDASVDALLDAINWKLYREGAVPV